MMLRMTVFVLGVWSAQLAAAQTCSTSSDCAAGYCCKDLTTGVTLVDESLGFLEIQGRSGQCVIADLQPGDVCDDHCGCPGGYECYRRISGICCPPRTCITIAEAHADREFWRCRLPPPRRRSLNEDDHNNHERRQRFLDPSCPELVAAAAPGGAEP